MLYAALRTDTHRASQYLHDIIQGSAVTQNALGGLVVIHFLFENFLYNFL